LRNVREHIAGFEAGQLAVLAHRDNPCVLYGHISHPQQKAFLVLLALNGWYFPAYKWMYRSLDSMPVKPQRVVERFRRVFKVSYVEAVADTVQVLHETLDLAEQRFRQIDTTGVHQWLIITRTAHWPSERWHADEVLL
jgi:hypothetical protein